MKSKLFILFILVQTIACSMFGQLTQGKIVYERKTNLYKKFKDDNVTDWIKERDKIKIDYFELLFNDSLSLFRPQESELKETMWWATEKNVVYQNFNIDSRFVIKKIWGEPLNILDTLYDRKWKITESKRVICGYNCRKAIWQYNDSVRIYAWYCDDIIPSVGPESFYGLPGAILGLASEDGGIIYFAKSVERIDIKTTEITKPKTKDKVYTSQELKTKLEKEFGKEKWGKAMIKNTFGYW
ncbi:MAG TPA: GLPGLI family protein [Bacteroidia bacterium]|nr:GLPGLI family protein [Bacteroidia bacterium]